MIILFCVPISDRTISSKNLSVTSILLSLSTANYVIDSGDTQIAEIKDKNISQLS